MKVYALIWYGVDEQCCYGVVNNEKLAKEWVDRSPDHGVEEFQLNEMPPLKQWRDTNCFPPVQGPPTKTEHTIQAIYYDQILRELGKPSIFDE